MRKGTKLICVKDYAGFKSGKKYEITYVDNEKSHIMISIEGKLYPIDIINKNFKIV